MTSESHIQLFDSEKIKNAVLLSLLEKTNESIDIDSNLARNFLKKAINILRKENEN